MQTIDRQRLYLNDAITEFQHKCKLIEIIRPVLPFKIARVHGDLLLLDLQSRVQQVASSFAGGPQTYLTSNNDLQTTHIIMR